MALTADLLAAKKHLAQSQPERALAPLLSAWRSCRAPAIAEAIDQVSATVKREPLEGSAKKKHETFLALLARGDPADGARLLAFLGQGQTAHLVEGVEALAGRPADPRFTGRALELLQHPAVTSSASFPAWRRVFNLLVSNEDTRALEVLRKLDFNAVLGPHQEYSAEFFDGRARKAAEALGAVKVPELPAADAALVRDLLGGQRAATQDLVALEAAVFAAPDEDAPRLVFADALLERGDPRGEFIGLQFTRAKRRLTGVERLREFELLEEHAQAWLGPLALTLNKYVELALFERGFVHTLAVDSEKEHSLQVLRSSPGFSTVRTLVLNLRESVPLPEAMLRSEAFAHLTGLGGLPRQATRELLCSKERWPYATLITHAPHYELPGFRTDLELLCSSKAVPKLTTLKVSGYLLEPSSFKPLWQSANGKRLRGFGASQGIYKLGAWVKEIEARGLDAQLSSFDLGFDFGARDFAALLTRGADGRLSDLELWKRPTEHAYGSPKVSVVAAQLEVLPADRLTAFRYVGRLAKGDKKRLEAALQRQTKLNVLELT